jgi:hypothetical protein
VVSRRRYIALVAVAGIVAGIALLAWLNRPRDDPAKATVGDAVRSFRAGGEGGRHEVGPGEPALGVYRYATRGSESAKTALGGTSHDYRGLSTIVLSAGRCGERERWQVLEGRWTEAESCAGPSGRQLGTVTEFHEFFGVEQEDSFRCEGAAVPGLDDLRPGVQFSNSCESDGSSISNSAKVAGFETVSVGGEPFPAVRVVSMSRLDGETSGTARREDWRRRSDGLLLRRTATSVADASAAGTDAHYSESYTIRLLDPEPRR